MIIPSQWLDKHYKKSLSSFWERNCKKTNPLNLKIICAKFDLILNVLNVKPAPILLTTIGEGEGGLVLIRLQCTCFIAIWLPPFYKWRRPSFKDICTPFTHGCLVVLEKSCKCKKYTLSDKQTDLDVRTIKAHKFFRSGELKTIYR